MPIIGWWWLPWRGRGRPGTGGPVEVAEVRKAACGESGVGSSCPALCLVQSASTWRMPAEWAISERGGRRRSRLRRPTDQLVVAPEAVLYSPIGEATGWNSTRTRRVGRPASGADRSSSDRPDRPLALTEYYRRLAALSARGLRAALGRRPGDERRLSWSPTSATPRTMPAVGPGGSDPERRRHEDRRRPARPDDRRVTLIRGRNLQRLRDHRHARQGNDQAPSRSPTSPAGRRRGGRSAS